MPVSVCMCMYFFFCFAQDAKGKRLPRPGPGALQCAVKKGIKCQQNSLVDSGTRTPVYRVTSPTEPTVALTHGEIWGYLFPLVKYTHIQTIHTYTHIYIQYMQIHAHTGTYMHAPITVGRGLWGAVADAVCLRERRNFPNRLGWGLGPGRQARIWPGTPISRTGGAVQGPPTGEEGGGARNRVVRGVQGWRKKVFAPMTWDALSEARRVPPTETVIWGRSGDSCACRYNTDIYIRYIHIHAIQTHTYIDPPAKIDLS